MIEPQAPAASTTRQFVVSSGLQNIINLIAAGVTIFLFFAGPFKDITNVRAAAWATAAVFFLSLTLLTLSIHSSVATFTRDLQTHVVDGQKKALEQLHGKFQEDLSSIEARQVPAVRVFAALPAWARVCHEIRQLSDEDKWEGDSVIMHAQLRNQIVAAKENFENISGVDARLCIKVLYQASDHFPTVTGYAVKAICRSNTEVPDDRPLPDLVTENTGFQDIVFGGNPYYMSGDVKAPEARFNTTNPRATYSSVVIWPIRAYTRAQAERTSGPRDFLGFLCLDSETANAFKKEQELQLGWWLVDCLAQPLELAVTNA